MPITAATMVYVSYIQSLQAMESTRQIEALNRMKMLEDNFDDLVREELKKYVSKDTYDELKDKVNTTVNVYKSVISDISMLYVNPPTRTFETDKENDKGSEELIEEFEEMYKRMRVDEKLQLTNQYANAMNDVISMAGGKIVQYGGLTSVAMDEQQPVRTALFTSGNIAKDSMQIEYSFDTTSDYDGVQIEYRDPSTFQPSFITYPPAAKMPDTFVLFGCTDPVYAEQYATYLYRVRRTRRKQVTFTTELEGLVPQIGARFAVSHPLPSWGHSGVIVDVITELSFRVDAYLNWDGGAKVMMLRSSTGTPSTIYTVTRGAADNIVVFGEVPDVTVNDAELQEPTSYTFGDDGEIVSDFILTKITPQDQTRVQIQGQTYTAFIYELAPPHMRVEV